MPSRMRHFLQSKHMHCCPGVRILSNRAYVGWQLQAAFWGSCSWGCQKLQLLSLPEQAHGGRGALRHSVKVAHPAQACRVMNRVLHPCKDPKRIVSAVLLLQSP